MTTRIVKAIVAGVLAGIALFLAPFILLRILLIFLLIRLIFGLLGGRGRRWNDGPGRPHFYFAFERRWHHMSEQEKREFRSRMEKDYFNPMDQQQSTTL